MNAEPIVQSEVSRKDKYTNAYIWNLEKQHWWSYLQSSKGDADIKNRLLDTVGEGEGGVTGENSIETYTLQNIISAKQIASGNLLCDVGNPKPVLCDNIEGWDGEGSGREAQEGEDICRHVASSHWCMAETITILWSNYPLIKNFKRENKLKKFDSFTRSQGSGWHCGSCRDVVPTMVHKRQTPSCNSLGGCSNCIGQVREGSVTATSKLILYQS